MNTLKIILYVIQLPIAIVACYYAFFKQNNPTPPQTEERRIADKEQEGQP